MNNNDILRRLRFALNQSDAQVLELLRLVERPVDPPLLTSYLAKDTAPEFVPCPDDVLRAFLDGLVLQRRGPRDPASPAPRPDRLDNNLILRKLRIALDLKEPEMLTVLKLGGMEISPSELGALFRSEGHKHYRPCGDQLLRNFLKGLTARRLRR